MRPILSLFAFLALFLLLVAPAAARGEPDAVVAGRVVAREGGRPLSGALVAVYDEKGRVAAVGATDPDGRYAIGISKGMLRLPGGRRRGSVVGSVVGGVGRVMRIVVGEPVKAALRVVTSSQVAQVDTTAAKAGVAAAGALAGGAVDLLKGGDKKPVRREAMPAGTLWVRVVADERKEYYGPLGTFGFDEVTVPDGRREKRRLVAAGDEVRLAGPNSPEPSEAPARWLLLSDARVAPAIAGPDAAVTLSVRLALPPDEDEPEDFVVVAKSDRLRETIALSPSGRAPGLFEAQLPVGRRTPSDDHRIVFVAYESPDGKPNGRLEREIEKAGLFDPKRPFVYRPDLIASRNRAEVRLTVYRQGR